MGGSTTSTQTVQIPPEVLRRYQEVNRRAEDVSNIPFQPYSFDPSAFVAPLTPTQQAGIYNVNQAAGLAQPYFTGAQYQLAGAQQAAMPFYMSGAQNIGYGQDIGAALGAQAGQTFGGAYGSAQPAQQAALGLTGGAAGAVRPGELGGAQIGQYMNPYLGAVAGSTMDLMRRESEQAQMGQLGNAIRSGAFGGDRAGIAAANLAREQELARGNVLSNLFSGGYQQALQTAQQQQQLGLGAEQANRAAQLAAAGQLGNLAQQQYGMGMGLGQAYQGLGQQQYGQALGAAQAQQGLGQGLYGMGAGTAQQMAALGTGAQGAALQGAQAQLAAGQAAQQTEQAGLQSLYNQFLQQQSYPFQVAQFLGNIAMGTGSLSGSTTTTRQPGGFFSDRRLKEDVREVGKTNDGQPIYAYKYKGEPRTQLGLMAQDVEKVKPEAVGEVGGYKTVDYAKATEDAARMRALGGPIDVDPEEEERKRKAEIAVKEASKPTPVPEVGAAKVNLPTQQGLNIPQDNKDAPKLDAPEGVSAKDPTMDQAAQAASIIASLAMVFSDRKLKKNVHKVGELFDGQPVYSYKYKALGGAMGGSVEPSDAYQGFQQGGSPGFAAPNDMAAILAAQQQMYGPFSQSGLYGGASGGMPGSPSYVPQGSLPVSSLATAGSLPEPPSVLDSVEQATRIGEAGTKVYDAYQKYQGRKAEREAKKNKPVATPTSTTVGPQMASGGNVTPYGSIGPQLNIPTGGMVGSAGLTTAGDLPEQESSADKLEKALSIASDASDIAEKAPKAAKKAKEGVAAAKKLFGFNSGGSAGREGFQEGGTKKKEQGLFSEILQDIQDYAGYGVTAESAAAQREKLAARDRPSATPPATAPATAKPPSSGGARPPASERRTPPPTGGVAPPAADATAGAPIAAPPAATPRPGLDVAAPTMMTPGAFDSALLQAPNIRMPTRGQKITEAISGARESLSKPENLIPLLSGIAAMGTAPTYHLGVALAAGLGAGTKSYTDIRKQMADIERTKADTQQSRVLTAAEAQTIPQNAIFVRSGITYVMLADNKIVTLAEWHKMGKPPTAGTAQAAEAIKNIPGSETISGASAPAATTPSSPKEPSVPEKPAATTGDQAVKDYKWNPTISEETKRKAEADSEALLAMPETQRNAFISKSIADEEAIFADATSAAEAGTSLNQLARQISALDGPLGAGPLNQMKTTLFARVNDIMDTFSLPEELRILPTDVDKSVIANKLSTALQFQGVQAAGERSFAALNAIAAATPGANMPKEAALEILANMYIDKQKSLDQARYLEDYKNLAAMPGMYKSAQAQLAFRTDYNDQYYEGQRQRLNQILRGGKNKETGTTLIDDILNGKIDPAALDKELGMPGFTRFFFNR